MDTTMAMMARYRMMDTRHMSTTATCRARLVCAPPAAAGSAAPCGAGCGPRPSCRGGAGGHGREEVIPNRGWAPPGCQEATVHCSRPSMLQPSLPPHPAPLQPNTGLLMSQRGTEREVVLSGSPFGWRARQGVGDPCAVPCPPCLKEAPGLHPQGNLPRAPRLAHTHPPYSLDPQLGPRHGHPSGAQAHKGLSRGPESLVGPRRSLGLRASKGERVTNGAARGSGGGGEGGGAAHHHQDHHGACQHAAHAAPLREVGLVLTGDGVQGRRGGRGGELGPWPLLEGSRHSAAARTRGGGGGEGGGPVWGPTSMSS